MLHELIYKSTNPHTDAEEIEVLMRHDNLGDIYNIVVRYNLEVSEDLSNPEDGFYIRHLSMMLVDEKTMRRKIKIHECNQELRELQAKGFNQRFN